MNATLKCHLFGPLLYTVRTIFSKARDLEKIEKKFKTIKIGSYPYFKPGNFGTSIVLRAENEILLNEASNEVLSAIIKLGGKGKIVEENEFDERSF